MPLHLPCFIDPDRQGDPTYSVMSWAWAQILLCCLTALGLWTSHSLCPCPWKVGPMGLSPRLGSHHSPEANSSENDFVVMWLPSPGVLGTRSSLGRCQSSWASKKVGLSWPVTPQPWGPELPWKLSVIELLLRACAGALCRHLNPTPSPCRGEKRGLPSVGGRAAC